jgi:DNA modification methylase
LHIAQKGAQLYPEHFLNEAQMIQMVTKPGDTVFDPMRGSGTTGVAAYHLGRNSILCDISPEFMEMTRKRVEAESDLNGRIGMRQDSAVSSCRSAEPRS